MARWARWARLVFWLAISCASVGPIHAAAASEHVVSIPVQDRDGRSVHIDGILFRPAGDGPFPLAILNHGTWPGGAAAQAAMGRVRFEAPAREFLKLGFAVLVPTRRGYGTSPGPYVETLGKCEKGNYLGVARESARDVLAAIEFARRLPFIEPSRIVLAGTSAGGLAALAAAAAHPPGVRAAINFAGGRGALPDGVVCGAPNLVAAMGDLGSAVAVPSLWIYAANDRSFGPALARAMRDAFTAAGGRVSFFDPGSIDAPNGDGHSYFSIHPDHWGPLVEVFLRAEGILPARSFNASTTTMR